MSGYDDDTYYDDIAEDWYGVGGSGSGGGGAKKIKKKALPTAVGKQRVGGGAWIGVEKSCPKDCKKKCCIIVKDKVSLNRH